jgi:hypothetical protein
MENENIIFGDNFWRNKKLERIVIIVTTSKEPLIDFGEPLSYCMAPSGTTSTPK